MGKYIDADRFRAEIEKTYKSEIQPWLSGVSATSAIYDYVLPLIDSLQQEQQEQPIPNDLEKAARKSAIAPFNLDVDEEHLYEYPYLPIAEQKFKEGAKWDREQMMSEAVEGEVFDDYDKDTCEHHLTILSTVPSGYKEGDKVRIVICKKED